MENWFLHLMNDSVKFLKREGSDKCVDLIESTPFGLLETVFGECHTIADVEEKCEIVYTALDLCRNIIYETPSRDDDTDWDFE